MSYAVDGMHHLSRATESSGALVGDILIVLGYAGGAVAAAAGTLRRQTA
jgi:hypothetical protein